LNISDGEPCYSISPTLNKYGIGWITSREALHTKPSWQDKTRLTSFH
jgi:hypothetical protein